MIIQTTWFPSQSLQTSTRNQENLMFAVGANKSTHLVYLGLTLVRKVQHGFILSTLTAGLLEDKCDVFSPHLSVKPKVRVQARNDSSNS